jgi:hypothetical protein
MLSRCAPILFLWIAGAILVPACTKEDISLFDIGDAAATMKPRVSPGGVLDVGLTVRNTGKATWEPDEVRLAFAGDASWKNAALSLAGSIPPGQTGTFTGKLVAPHRPGIHGLKWRADHDGEPFGSPLSAEVEVSCQDGVFCNGAERFVDGGCTAGTDPCDDGQACTQDMCDESAGTCHHTLGASCASCFSACTPDCTGKVCGNDGCGGSCGDCASGEGCAAPAGTCQPAIAPGTCASPLPLAVMAGDQQIQGDTTTGLHQAIPVCNSKSAAVELVYSFTTTQPLGLEARMSGYDTVLHLRKENPATPQSECLDNSSAATVACSDDSTPPGNGGSRIAVPLDPGTYYLIADGFDAAKLGPFTLSVRLAANGCVPKCDGLYCGDDDGCGSDCGTCDAGFACVEGRCEPDPCAAQCSGRACGDDGCGGSCGTCAGGSLCVPATGQCQQFADCDHLLPACTPACGAGQFCGTDCACHSAADPMPDLVLNGKRLLDEILFDTVDVNSASCSVLEGCVGGTGTRRVLRFSVQAINQGHAPLTVPSPAERPDLFTFSPCHGHHHFSGFASYALLGRDGQTVLVAHKQAYCIGDSQQIMVGPGVSCAKQYDCDTQGIQAGWSDLYGNALDCQWLDITGVAPGDYLLEVVLNPGRRLEEVSFDNNTVTVPVTITTPAP